MPSAKRTRAKTAAKKPAPSAGAMPDIGEAELASLEKDLKPQISQSVKLQGKFKGQKRVRVEDKRRALIALEFMGGDVKKTAAMLGINCSTLEGWRQQIHYKVDDTPPVPSGDVVNTLTRLAERLSLMILMNAQEMPLKEQTATMGSVLERLETLSKLKLMQIRMDRIKDSDEQEQPATGPAPAPAPQATLDTAQADKWEAMVRRVVSEAHADGNPITREEAAKGIMEAFPDSRPYLKTEHIN